MEESGQELSPKIGELIEEVKLEDEYFIDALLKKNH
jgi:hypothetical protein